MIFIIKGYDRTKKAKLPPGKLSIRWRNASATYVIYIAGRVLESGFESERHAQRYLQERFGYMEDRT